MSGMSRVMGMMMGTFAGDCLGTPYIFMKSDQLFEMAPEICWKVAGCGMESLLLMAGIKAAYHFGIDIENLARAYQKCARDGYELDYVSAICFGGRKKSVQKLYRESECADYGSLCSSQLLVRQIPVVLAGIRWDCKTLFQKVESECRLTHNDPVCIEFAKLYALCLQQVLQGKGKLEIWDSLFENVQSRTGYQTLLNSYYAKPVCDDECYSQACVAFGLAMYHFWHDTPMVSALRSVVLCGGATDVNAAVTGALCGARQGIQAIPASWRRALLDEEENSHGRRRKKALFWSRKIVSRSEFVLHEPDGSSWYLVPGGNQTGYENIEFERMAG